jgi:hypothetical protein
MHPAGVFRSLQVQYCTVHVDFYIRLKMSGLTLLEAGQLQNQYVATSTVEKQIWHTTSYNDVSILG